MLRIYFTIYLEYISTKKNIIGNLLGDKTYYSNLLLNCVLKRRVARRKRGICWLAAPNETNNYAYGDPSWSFSRRDIEGNPGLVIQHINYVTSVHVIRPLVFCNNGTGKSNIHVQRLGEEYSWLPEFFDITDLMTHPENTKQMEFVQHARISTGTQCPYDMDEPFSIFDIVGDQLATRISADQEEEASNRKIRSTGGRSVAISVDDNSIPKERDPDYSKMRECPGLEIRENINAEGDIEVVEADEASSSAKRVSFAAVMK